MIKLENNTISFEDTIIFVCENNEKAKMSYENVKDVVISDYTHYDVIDTDILSGKTKLNLYNNAKLPDQDIGFIVVNGILFIENSNEYKEYITLEFYKNNNDTSDLKVLEKFLDLYASNSEDFMEENPIFCINGLDFANIEEFSLADREGSTYKGYDLRDCIGVMGYEDLKYIEFGEMYFLSTDTLDKFFDSTK